MSWQTLREIYWRPTDASVSNPKALVAGSGLIRAEDGFWAVADDLHHIIHIPFEDKISEGYRIFAGDLPEDFKARKKVKPDTEAFFEIPSGENHKIWIAMPSGSKPHRIKGARILRSEKGLGVTEINFEPLYAELHKQIRDLNIEGGAVHGNDVVLLQRGNGEAGHNAIIHLNFEGFLKGLEGSWNSSNLNLRVEDANLGKWDDVNLTFTDGFVHQGKLYFSAAAEATLSTYEDGDVLGSVVGVWQNGRAQELTRLEKHKIEGIAPEIHPGGLRIFGITDADESLSPSLLLKCDL